MKILDSDPMIKSLTDELNTIFQRATEIKKFINQTYTFHGKTAPYTDVDFTPVGGSMNIAPDQFFGKGLAPAVGEFLKAKGRAASAQEIFDALQKGGFEWPENWKTSQRLKNLAISIGKNRDKFVPVKTSEGNAYGLYDFYPEKKKMRERGMHLQGQNNLSSDETNNTAGIDKNKIHEKLKELKEKIANNNDNE